MFLDDNCFAGIDVAPIANIHEEGRFYIHPDNVPLLEPRPGEILIRAGVEEHVTMHNLFLFVHRAPDTEHLFESFHESGMIIQRNGLPFHWPQAEQAP
jgi:hypothetical protein